MTISTLVAELKEQFSRQFDAFRNACKLVPEEEWARGEVDSGEIDYLVPARQVYHVIFAIDSYMNHMGFMDYMEHRRFKINWETPDTTELPSRETARTYLDDMQEKTEKWLDDLGDAGLMCADDECPWVGKLKISRALYNLRHNQAHIGEINAELRRRGLARVKANGSW